MTLFLIILLIIAGCAAFMFGGFFLPSDERENPSVRSANQTIGIVLLVIGSLIIMASHLWLSSYTKGFPGASYRLDRTAVYTLHTLIPGMSEKSPSIVLLSDNLGDLRLIEIKADVSLREKATWPCPARVVKNTNGGLLLVPYEFPKSDS